MGHRALHFVVSSMCKCRMSASFSMVIFIDVVFAKYNMVTNTVIVTCDVHMEYTGEHPVYRLYVGDELFTERTWIWTNDYLNECITLEAPYGLYPITYELLPHPNAQLTVKNQKIVSGPARWRKNMRLEIHDESS